MGQRIFTEDLFKDKKKDIPFIEDYKDSNYSDNLRIIYLKKKKERITTAILLGIYFGLFLISYFIV